MPRNSSTPTSSAPALGEHHARLGYGAQDRTAADIILRCLKSADFVSARLADLEGGRVDDFVLVWKDRIQGNSVKWTGVNDILGWSDMCGAGEPLMRQLADGWLKLRDNWPDKRAEVCLRTNRPLSDSTHGNQLVPGVSAQSFFENEWGSGRTTSPNPQMQAAWELLKNKTGLDPAIFPEFVACCSIMTGLPLPDGGELESLDFLQWEREFNQLRQAINDRVELNPSQIEFAAADIAKAIGLRPARGAFFQQFPQPEIGYEENESTAKDVRNLIKNHESGYLALTGPAGAGKSTLVNALIQSEPFGLPYFAFLPNGQADPRERGDSLAFYRHVILILDQWEDVRRSHGVSDVRQAKEALASHMARIKQRYLDTGRKTIILIDGLDHVTREDMDRPLHLDLPLPEELSPGCLFLVSSQPQAIPQLRAQIRRQLQQEASRNVEMSPLPREAVYGRLAEEPTGLRLSQEGKGLVFASCLGNPLILTYLIKAIRSNPSVPVASIIGQLGKFNGDVNSYYAERFEPVLDNPASKRLLGLLSRARRRTPLSWLQTWPEWEEFERLFRFEIGAFFHNEDGWLSFVHNSMVSYLRESTLPTLPGSDVRMADSAYYGALADRCPDGSSSEWLSLDRLYYQVMAGDHGAVIRTATDEWFRQGANTFVPAAELSQLVRLCYRSAVSCKDYGALLRFITIAKEIDRRDATVSAEDLAERFLRLGQPGRAIEQIASGPELRVEQLDALRFSVKLAQYAESQEDDYMLGKARSVFDLSKPVYLLFAPDDSVLSNSHHYGEMATAWAEAAPYFMPLEEAVATVQSLKAPDDISQEDLQARLFFSLLATAHSRGQDDQVVLRALEGLGNPEWSLIAGLRHVRYLQQNGEAAESELNGVRQRLNVSAVEGATRLRLGECLNRAGFKEEATALVSNIELPAPKPYISNGESELAGFWSRLRVARLRKILGLAALPLSPTGKPDDEGAARVAAAAAGIGEMLAEAELGAHIPVDLEERLGRFLNYHLKRVRTELGRFEYQLFSARGDVYDALLRLAASYGPPGGAALRQAFLACSSLLSPAGIPAKSRRKMVLGLQEIGALTVTEAISMVGDAVEDSGGHETRERTEACFDIAEAFCVLGDEASTDEWIGRAGMASHGIGYEKDYQMATWTEWLDRSLPETLSGPDLELLQVFARAVEVAGGRAERDAAQALVKSCFRRCPMAGAKLGLEMVERQVLDLEGCLHALIEVPGAASCSLRESVFSRLLTLISLWSLGEPASAIVRDAKDNAEAVQLAGQCARAIRVNCQPELRVAAAREIQDALRERNADCPPLDADLPADPDDKSSSSRLYKMEDGSVRTVAEVGALLSDPGRQGEWDPNSEENKHFQWSAALESVMPQSPAHLELLERSLSGRWGNPSDGLAFLASAAHKIGDIAMVEDYAQRALAAVKEGGWIYSYDHAPKRRMYEALIKIDPARWLQQARDDFEADLLQGRVWSYGLTLDIADIYDALQWEWPAESVRGLLGRYVAAMSTEEDLPPAYASLSEEPESQTPDEAICWLLVQLYASPVREVDTGARQASVDYLLGGGKGFGNVFASINDEETIAMERVMAVLHVAAKTKPASIRDFEGLVLRADSSVSLAVRSIARRICRLTGWTLPPKPPESLAAVYSLAFPMGNAETERMAHRITREVPGASLGLALHLYEADLKIAAEASGIAYEAILVRARQIYGTMEKAFKWTSDGGASLKWLQSAVPVLSYVRPEAMIAREAMLQVLGELTKAGKLPGWYLESYDLCAPCYDPDLENLWPDERPPEVSGIDSDDLTYKWGEWVQSLGTDGTPKSPARVGGQMVLAERSNFKRPTWGEPKEFRVASLVPSQLPLRDISGVRNIMPERHGQTRAQYADDDNTYSRHVVVIGNQSREIFNRGADWLALNPTLGRSLGWKLDSAGLFRWVDSAGQVMAESVWWRDGWVKLKPPRSSTLGEGWLVLCNSIAYGAIATMIAPAKMVTFCQRSFKEDDQDERSLKSLSVENPFPTQH